MTSFGLANFSLLKVKRQANVIQHGGGLALSSFHGEVLITLDLYPCMVTQRVQPPAIVNLRPRTVARSNGFGNLLTEQCKKYVLHPVRHLQPTFNLQKRNTCMEDIVTAALLLLQH